MRVEVETVGAANPGRIGRFTVKVVLPEEFPEPYAALVHRVAQSCPAHNTLHHAAEVAIEVETTALANAP
jgi:uncharacterized OsmC-like protein